MSELQSCSISISYFCKNSGAIGSMTYPSYPHHHRSLRSKRAHPSPLGYSAWGRLALEVATRGHSVEVCEGGTAVAGGEDPWFPIFLRKKNIDFFKGWLWGGTEAMNPDEHLKFHLWQLWSLKLGPHPLFWPRDLPRFIDYFEDEGEEPRQPSSRELKLLDTSTLKLICSICFGCTPWYHVVGSPQLIKTTTRYSCIHSITETRSHIHTKTIMFYNFTCPPVEPFCLAIAKPFFCKAFGYGNCR